jgi:hypothetical protein
LATLELQWIPTDAVENIQDFTPPLSAHSEFGADHDFLVGIHSPLAQNPVS